MDDTNDDNGDDNNGDGSADICGRESIQIRLSVSRGWVEDELLPAYPHVTTVSQAARTALLEGVEAATEETGRGVEAAIGRDIVAAMERLGGSVENCQAVQVNAPEDADADGDKA
jgi:hypothetical protein